MPRARGPSIPLGAGTAAGTQANALRANKNKGLAQGLDSGINAIIGAVTRTKDRKFRAGERERDRALSRDRMAQDESQFQQSMSLRDRQLQLSEMKAADAILAEQAEPLKKKAQALGQLVQSGAATPQQQQAFQQVQGELQALNKRRSGLFQRGNGVAMSTVKG